MAVKTIRLSDLATLSDEQQRAVFDEYVEGRLEPINGEIDDLNRRIAEFERRYEMSSETMQTAFADRSLRETAEIVYWLMLVDVRDGLLSQIG
jgi:hypothetical protein